MGCKTWIPQYDEIDGVFMELSKEEIAAKKRICLALDVATVKGALNLIKELSDLVGYFKIGKELHCAACNEGIPIIEKAYDSGVEIFLDLKFHDTPQTVYKAVKSSIAPGVALLNIHIAGGRDMCNKSILGCQERTNELGIPQPKVIGVTVLTSLDDIDLKAQNLGISYENLVIQRAKLASEWGLDGIVCPANKTKKIKNKLQISKNFLFVTPGIKWAGKMGMGQKQLYTPDKAVIDCENSILVIGSAITKSEDPRKTDRKSVV